MKNDNYKKARGGWSRLLEISCERCEQLICRYQKDGPGLLKRMYIDRMDPMSTRDNELACPNCRQALGTRIIYEKENRPAYRLFVGSITKKIIKSSVK